MIPPLLAGNGLYGTFDPKRTGTRALVRKPVGDDRGGNGARSATDGVRSWDR
jgi:hypothetical protein